MDLRGRKLMVVATIMGSPALGAWVVFQVAATRVFISTPLLGATASHYGRVKIACGAAVGLAVLIVIAVLLYLGLAVLKHPEAAAISAILLVALGLYLAMQFGLADDSQYKDYPYTGVLPEPRGRARRKGWTIALWVIIVEGLIVLPAWLAIVARSRPLYASIGVAVGVAVGGAVGLRLRHDKVDAELRSLLIGLLTIVVVPYAFYHLVAIVVQV